MNKLFIPIKGESQRVPGKNFRKLDGKELYIHQIDKFKENFKIYVDTDSDEIFKKLKDYHPNVIVYKRNSNLIGHEVSVNLLIFNFIKKFDINDYVSQIHVTSPFLKKETIKKSFELIKNDDYDSIVGANLIKSRLWCKELNIFKPLNHNPKELIQTQDLNDIYEENSTLYTFHINSFLKNNNRICDKPYFMVIDFPENIDIDTEKDWKYVKKVYEKKIN